MESYSTPATCASLDICVANWYTSSITEHDRARRLERTRTALPEGRACAFLLPLEDTMPMTSAARKSERIVMTLTPEQSERITARARRLGMAAAEWTRSVVIAELLADEKAAQRDGQAA